jgi:hypothetical protein
MWLPDPEQKFRDVDLPAAESLQDDARERNGMPRRHLRVAG